MPEICRQGGNTLNCTKVLIAFVPGVMGSRLKFDAGGYWDPDDTSWNGAMSRWYFASAESERSQLKFDKGASVMFENADVSPALTRNEISKGYGEVVWSFYGPFLRALAGIKFGTCQTPVYAFGYDWRQSNKASGKDLAARINKAADNEKTDKVIIVTHSMGGLAARSALFQDAGLSGKLKGAIHVFQPATGAVVAYRRFFTGMVEGVDADSSSECTLFGDTADKFATIISGLNGPIELLPNTSYVDKVPPGATWKTTWLDYMVAQPIPPVSTAGSTYQGVPPIQPDALLVAPATVDQLYTRVSLGGSAIYQSYVNSRHPPGMGGPTDDTNIPAELALRVGVAKEFHSWLGAYKHDKTFAIYGSGVSTDVRFLQGADGVNKYDGVEQRRLFGDGTVPASSASALFPGQAHKMADIGDNSARQFEVMGVQHAGAFNDSDVQVLTGKLIQRALGMA